MYEFLSEQGGLEREIINHANMLQEAGYEVKILTCHLDKKIFQQLPFQGLKIEVLSKVKFKYEILNLGLCALGLNNIRKYNPDAFLVYSFPSNFLIRSKSSKKINYINHLLHAYHMPLKERVEWAKNTQGIKRWASVIGSLFLNSWITEMDKKIVSKKNHLHFTNSNFTKKRIDNHYGINSIVSYPPLDPRFDSPSKKKINEKYIFSSSRIIPDKKYELLISAMKYMQNKIPLYIAGSVEDSYKDRLLSFARKGGAQIKFLGRLNTEQIIDYYTNADLFAFPTPCEDFGLVPAESMACGTPVVIWGDGAGPTEQVIDGLNGYYARPYDVKDFAAKMDKVIDSGMKQKNRKEIISSVKRFRYSEIKKDFVKHIDKLLASKK